MIILPAIDIHQGRCVRLFQGDYATAQVVAGDPVETARRFESQGAGWLHMVDLDGAKEGRPVNRELILRTVRSTGMRVELGGGIRDMETIEDYLDQGIERVILGSVALEDPNLVKAAVERFGPRIAVGIDARDGKAAAQGWTQASGADYIDLAREMEQLGVETIICTDIGRDGTQTGPNLDMLEKLDRAVGCNIVASGGVSCLKDLTDLRDLGLYGAIAGKAVYSGAVDLEEALISCRRLGPVPKTELALNQELERYFRKGELIPAVVQDADSGQVLMLAYMNQESLRRTLETGYTWFYSRSRSALWKKGETSGNTQRVVSICADCDDDTLLVRVTPAGPACHTGRQSCFYKTIMEER